MASGLERVPTVKRKLQPVSKPELGTKRFCPSCGTKFYDLNRMPITCPKCGQTQQADASPKRASAAAALAEHKAAKPAPKPEPVEPEVAEEPVVSLEEADQETAAAPRARAAPLDEDESPEIEDAVEIEDEEEEEDTLLEAEDDYGDDVTTIIDADLEEED